MFACEVYISFIVLLMSGGTVCCFQLFNAAIALQKNPPLVWYWCQSTLRFYHRKQIKINNYNLIFLANDNTGVTRVIRK